MLHASIMLFEKAKENTIMKYNLWYFFKVAVSIHFNYMPFINER